MSNAMDLLNSLGLDELIDPTPVNDILYVDAQTRTIKIPSTELVLGVETDENVERKHFRCPKIVGDNIDLTKLSLKIYYRNANGHMNTYDIDDVSEDGDFINFSWLLEDRVLVKKGQVQFSIVAVSENSDGTLRKEWNTAPTSGNVLEGMELTLTEEEEEIFGNVLDEMINQIDVIAAECVNAHLDDMKNYTDSVVANKSQVQFITWESGD